MQPRLLFSDHTSQNIEADLSLRTSGPQTLANLLQEKFVVWLPNPCDENVQALRRTRSGKGVVQTIHKPRIFHWKKRTYCSHVLHKKVLMPCDKKVTRGFLSENLEKFSLSLTESWLRLESTWFLLESFLSTYVGPPIIRLKNISFLPSENCWFMSCFISCTASEVLGDSSRSWKISSGEDSARSNILAGWGDGF